MAAVYLVHQVAGQSVKHRSLRTLQHERHVVHPPQEASQMVWPRELRIMNLSRIPIDLLYGELVEGSWPTGSPHLCNKDVWKRDLKKRLESLQYQHRHMGNMGRRSLSLLHHCQTGRSWRGLYISLNGEAGRRQFCQQPQQASVFTSDTCSRDFLFMRVGFYSH